MNIKTILKSSVAASALFALAAPVSMTAMAADDTFSSGASTKLVMSGFVARAIMHADDGTSSRTFFTTNTGSSGFRIRWLASGTLSDSVTAGAVYEAEGPGDNMMNSVQLYTSAPGDSGTEGAVTSDDTWNLRHQYVWVTHKTMGKLSLGNTSVATDGIGGDSGRIAGRGLAFVDTTAATPVSSGRILNSTFNNLNMDRVNILRYDSPTFGGAHVRVGKWDTGGWDTSLRYAGKFGAVAVAANVGYGDRSGATASTNFTALGSLTLTHDSGLSIKGGIGKTNFSGAASKVDTASQQGGRDDPHYFSINLGYSMPKLVSVGSTSFGAVWQNTNNAARSKTDAVSYAVTATQSFDALGASMALSYQKYTVDAKQVTTVGADVTKTFDDIDVFALQTSFNF